MNHIIIKTTISLAAIIALLIMSLKTNDVISSELYASLAIILGAYSTSQLSKTNNNE
jgi:hypothetical protein